MTELGGARAGGRSLVWRLGAGAGLVGVPAGLGWECRPAAVVLAIVEVTVPLLVLLVAAGVAVFGSDRSSERVFRLLRMVTGREEPKGPAARRRPAARP